MTEELQQRVANLTCKTCLGNGTLGHCENKTMDGKLVPVFWKTPCPRCEGTGIARLMAVS